MASAFLWLSLLEEADRLDEIERRRRRRHARRIRNLHLMSRCHDYVHIYRLTEDLIKNLEEDLSPLLPVNIQPGRGLTNRIKLLCTLSFLANGSYQRNVGRNVNTFLSPTSISRSIHQIINVLTHPTIVKKYIRFPQNAAERQTLKERFYVKFNIPGVIGCIDSTLVSMVQPKEHEEIYLCCKGYHARNVQLITDADLNILHVDATYGAETDDSFVFNCSQIKYHLEQVTNSGEVMYLLGNSGYAQRPYLMTPIVNAKENSRDAYYTKLHATAHNSVERAIGVLKGRFRCLLVHRVLHYDPNMVAKIVIACCVLHNICNRAGIPAPVLSSEDIRHEGRLLPRIQHNSDEMEQTELDMGRLAQTKLVNRLWQSRGIQ